MPQIDPTYYDALEDEFVNVSTAVTSSDLESSLSAILQLAGCEVQTFEDAGVMTRNSGLVVTNIDPEGERFEYQLTIVRSR